MVKCVEKTTESNFNDTHHSTKHNRTIKSDTFALRHLANHTPDTKHGHRQKRLMRLTVTMWVRDNISLSVFEDKSRRAVMGDVELNVRAATEREINKVIR